MRINRSSSVAEILNGNCSRQDASNTVQFLYVFLNAREPPTEKFDDRKIESPGGEPAFFVLNLSVLKSFGQISRSPGPPTIQLAPLEMAGVALFLDAREHPTEKFDDRKI